MYKSWVMIGCIWGFTCGLSAAALAQENDPEAVIKYRQGVMRAQGGHISAMAQIVRGQVDYGDRLITHAKALNSIIGNIPELFPEGSDFGETEAKEEIWSDWEKFKESAKTAEQKSEVFLSTVASGDKEDIGKTFKDLGEACKACHKDFREEDE